MSSCERIRTRFAAFTLAALLCLALAAAGGPAASAADGDGQAAAKSAKKTKKKCKGKAAKGKKKKKPCKKRAGGLPGFPEAGSPPPAIPPPDETPTGPVATLSVSTTGAGTGSVLSNPTGIACGDDCSSSYPIGAQVSLHAVPAGNSDFVAWGGACSGAGDCEVTLDAAKSVTATFAIKTLDLNVSVVGAGGSIASAPAGVSCGSDCTHVYDYGQSVSLTPDPVAGWQFHGWTGACSGSGPCVVSMTADRSVGAIFTQGGVDRCRLIGPASTTAAGGLPTEGAVYAQVTEQYATDLNQAGNDSPPLVAQVGMGPLGTDPATTAGWTFTAAQQDPEWSPDPGPEASSDQYVGRPVAPMVEDDTSFSYAFRFSLDQGQTFTYCDLDGSQNGVQTDQLGTVLVTPFVPT